MVIEVIGQVWSKIEAKDGKSLAMADVQRSQFLPLNDLERRGIITVSLRMKLADKGPGVEDISYNFLPRNVAQRPSMKDYEGAERGKCLRCAEQGLECCEFVVHTEIEGEDDDDEIMKLSEEVYRQRPLLLSLQARLDSAHPKFEAADICGNCGCGVMDHEVTPITPEESQVLDVARGLFYPFDLRLCIKQSYKDTACLGLERDGFTYGEVGLLSFLRLLDRVMSLQEDFKQNGLQAKSRGVFYDLGCGAGKALVLAALHRIGFDRCVGVELLPGLATAARVLAEQFNRQNSKAPVQIVEGDMEKAWPDGGLGQLAVTFAMILDASSRALMSPDVKDTLMCH
eukprot:s35_g20.t1